MAKRRGMVARVVASGILSALAPDAVVLVALTLIGVTVYRLCPDAVWAYAGLVLLVPAVVVLKERANDKRPSS